VRDSLRRLMEDVMPILEHDKFRQRGVRTQEQRSATEPESR
jgi:hypothetical protein